MFLDLVWSHTWVHTGFSEFHLRQRGTWHVHLSKTGIESFIHSTVTLPKKWKVAWPSRGGFPITSNPGENASVPLTEPTRTVLLASMKRPFINVTGIVRARVIRRCLLCLPSRAVRASVRFRFGIYHVSPDLESYLLVGQSIYHHFSLFRTDSHIWLATFIRPCMTEISPEKKGKNEHHKELRRINFTSKMNADKLFNGFLFTFVLNYINAGQWNRNVQSFRGQ